VNGSKSDRFLDPVNPNNLHNHGDTFRGFLRLDRQSADAKNSFRFTALAGSHHRDVPNTYTQEAAGQDQHVRSNDENINAAWQRIFSQASVLEIGAFGRFSKFRLNPSPNDTPVTATSDRTLNNYGLTPSISWTNSNHEVKAGLNLKRYPIREHFTFGITDPRLNDPGVDGFNPNLAPYDLTRGWPEFAFDARRNGSYYAGYVSGQHEVEQSDRQPRRPIRQQTMSR